MAFGLPIAVTIGWTFATPAKRPAAVGLPGGEGAIGAAPEPVATTPMTAVRYSSRPYRPGAPSSAVVTPAPSTSVPATPATSAAATPTSAPPTATSSEPLPSLTLPPVPTPTEITTTPTPSGSAAPSTDPSTGP